MHNVAFNDDLPSRKQPKVVENVSFFKLNMFCCKFEILIKSRRILETLYIKINKYTWINHQNSSILSVLRSFHQNKQPLLASPSAWRRASATAPPHPASSSSSQRCSPSILSPPVP